MRVRAVARAEPVAVLEVVVAPGRAPRRNQGEAAWDKVRAINRARRAQAARPRGPGLGAAPVAAAATPSAATDREVPRGPTARVGRRVAARWGALAAVGPAPAAVDMVAVRAAVAVAADAAVAAVVVAVAVAGARRNKT